MLKAYYTLTKPGIIYGNVLTACGGFLLASKGQVDAGLLVATMAGISLVIASACVINNLTDTNIDKKMARTKQRALASGAIPRRSAVVYAVILGLLGFSALAVYTNVLTVALGVLAIVDYVVLYAVAKRRSVHGTIVGSIAGALPATAGYTAVAGMFDLGALLIFLIMTFWQMPHFFAIAMFRLKDYRAAGIPVLPAVEGLKAAKLQIVAYVGAFLAAVVLLAAAGYAGWWYLVVMVGFGAVWLVKGLQGFTAPDDVRWARKMFGFSLLVLLAFSFMLSVDSFLP